LWYSVANVKNRFHWFIYMIYEKTTIFTMDYRALVSPYYICFYRCWWRVAGSIAVQRITKVLATLMTQENAIEFLLITEKSHDSVLPSDMLIYFMYLFSDLFVYRTVHLFIIHSFIHSFIHLLFIHLP